MKRIRTADIPESRRNVFLFWEGPISDRTSSLISACIRTTKKFNPDSHIWLLSNSITTELQNQPGADYELVEWTLHELVQDTPLDSNQKAVDVYQSFLPNHRATSDLVRIVALYKWGGTYVDTDNICVRSLPENRNVVCRTYDPHSIQTIHKSDLSRCIAGANRENGKFPEIPFMLRNDCLLNFDVRHPLLEKLLNGQITINGKPLMHGTGLTWQLRLLDEVKNVLPNSKEVSVGLNLIYLFEAFLGNDWGVRNRRGEMYEIYRNILNIEKTSIGSLKMNREQALAIFYSALSSFPTASFLWINDKEKNDEIFQSPPAQQMRASSHIYHYILGSV